MKVETPVIFNPDVAEELSTADPMFQEARLVAHGSPILDFLLHRWNQDPRSRVTGFRKTDLIHPSLLLLYKAQFSGLVRGEEITPISVDLETLQARELTLEVILQQITMAPLDSRTNAGLSAGPVALDDLDIKFESAIKPCRELWERLFDSLNNEWRERDEGEYRRRKKLLETSLNRVFSKVKAAIEVLVRRLIALRYIQDFPNTDRLPDGEIDVRSIVGSIEGSPDLSDVFPQVQFDPSELKIRGKEVKEIAQVI